MGEFWCRSDVRAQPDRHLTAASAATTTAAVAAATTMLPQRVRAGKKVFVSHGINDKLFPIDPTSRRIVPQLKQSLPGQEINYVEFKGGHDVPAAISKQALEWFFWGAPVQSTRLDQRGR